jgi:trimethylamine--corrinoid protein Co-methyltransferase
MPQVHIELLTLEDIQAIHKTTLGILDRTGVIVHHAGVLQRLAEVGVRVDFGEKRARFSEAVVQTALDATSKRYILYGRDMQKTARFGYGDLNLMSSPGQYAWFDHVSGKRRESNFADTQSAAKVGNALPNITIVGAMTAPADVPTPIRDVVLTAELLKITAKPTRCWPISRRSSHYVLEMYAAVAGGVENLRTCPMGEAFVEPISPLQFPETGLDVMLEFIEYGQPVSFGPMAQVTATGPGTIAGTLAQENAEILAGIVIAQAYHPGTPVMYGGIPHIMDPRTSICSFGSPEQGLMAIAMTQISKFYGLPVYINVNLTDAKTLDAQAGMEKVGSLLLGALAGGDLLGHAGIVGTDHGGSLAWLVIDDEAMAYARRVVKGFGIDPQKLALDVVEEVGPGGHFLTHPHTLANYRQEMWIPGSVWTRDPYERWAEKGGQTISDRAVERVQKILGDYQPEPLDPALSKELDHIVACARQELVQ